MIAAYLGEGDEDEVGRGAGMTATLLSLSGVTAFYGAIQALRGHRPDGGRRARSSR